VSGFQGTRDQVGCILVGLAQLTARIRTGHVEVPEGNIPEIRRCAQVGQHMLDHDLRHAVGIDWLHGSGFGNRNLLGDAVNGRRGRIDKIPDAMGPHALEEIQCVGHVVSIILQRLPDGLLYLDAGRKVDDRRRREIPEHLVDSGAVLQIPPHQLSRQYGPLMPGGKIVEHAYLMPRFTQRLNRMAADIPSPARYQYTHESIRFSLFLIFFLCHFCHCLPVTAA